MDTTITIPDCVTPEMVTEARGEFVGALSSTYGAGRRFAAVLIGLLGTEWITMAHDAKGEAGDAMRVQRDALYTDLRNAGHTNPSVKWKQIKGYAADLIRAESGEGEGESAEGEGEGEGKAKHTRTPQLRLIEDLTALHKMCKRESKTLTEGQRKASLHIAAALGDLGVDVSKL